MVLLTYSVFKAQHCDAYNKQKPSTGKSALVLHCLMLSFLHTSVIAMTKQLPTHWKTTQAFCQHYFKEASTSLLQGHIQLLAFSLPAKYQHYKWQGQDAILPCIMHLSTPKANTRHTKSYKAPPYLSSSPLSVGYPTPSDPSEGLTEGLL